MLRVVILLMLSQSALAESLVATRTIRANTVINAEDLTLVSAELPGALGDPVLAIGQEARKSIYAGKPVRIEDIGPPTLVQRNQMVQLVYLTGALSISTEGRALDRGSEGEVLRVLNLESKNMVSGRVGPDGAVYVGLER